MVPSIRSQFPALPEDRIAFDPIQKVRVAFLDLHGLAVELVEPVGEDSPVARHLTKRVPLHHLCYSTPDMEGSLTDLRKRRWFPVAAPVPATAFEGRRIAWMVHPLWGLLELLEE